MKIIKFNNSLHVLKFFNKFTVYIYVKLIRGMCIMYEELLKKRIIIEFTNLLNDVEKEDDTDSYAQFMKEVILNTYGVN